MSKLEEFKIGDIVQLKSGGPEMTITKIEVDKEKKIVCHWFAGKKLEIGAFVPEELDKIRS